MTYKANDYVEKDGAASGETAKVASADNYKYTDADGKTVYVEATAFSPKATQGYCASCGEKVSCKKVIETSGQKTYGDIQGMWVVTYSDTASDYAYYIDVKLSSGAVTASKVIKSTTVKETGKTTTAVVLSADTPTEATVSIAQNGDLRGLSFDEYSSEGTTEFV